MFRQQQASFASQQTIPTISPHLSLPLRSVPSASQLSNVPLHIPFSQQQQPQQQQQPPQFPPNQPQHHPHAHHLQQMLQSHSQQSMQTVGYTSPMMRSNLTVLPYEQQKNLRQHSANQKSLSSGLAIGAGITTPSTILQRQESFHSQNLQSSRLTMQSLPAHFQSTSHQQQQQQQQQTQVKTPSQPHRFPSSNNPSHAIHYKPSLATATATTTQPLGQTSETRSHSKTPLGTQAAQQTNGLRINSTLSSPQQPQTASDFLQTPGQRMKQNVNRVSSATNFPLSDVMKSFKNSSTSNSNNINNASTTSVLSPSTVYSSKTGSGYFSNTRSKELLYDSKQPIDPKKFEMPQKVQMQQQRLNEAIERTQRIKKNTTSITSSSLNGSELSSTQIQQKLQQTDHSRTEQSQQQQQQQQQQSPETNKNSECNSQIKVNISQASYIERKKSLLGPKDKSVGTLVPNRQSIQPQQGQQQKKPVAVKNHQANDIVTEKVKTKNIGESEQDVLTNNNNNNNNVENDIEFLQNQLTHNQAEFKKLISEYSTVSKNLSTSIAAQSGTTSSSVTPRQLETQQNHATTPQSQSPSQSSKNQKNHSDENDETIQYQIQEFKQTSNHFRSVFSDIFSKLKKFERKSFDNGNTYSGSIDENGLETGYGILADSHGRIIYKGDWLAGKFNGFGILLNVSAQSCDDTTADVDYSCLANAIEQSKWIKYEGELTSNAITGFGTLFFDVKGNTRIVGNFEAGIPNGLCSFYAGSSSLNPEQQPPTSISGIWNQGILVKVVSQN